MGSNVQLRAFEPEDSKELHRWMNDADAIRNTGHSPVSYEEACSHVEKKKASGDIVMAIELDNSQLAGWVFLQKLEYEHGRASIGILLAPEYRGQGIAPQAMSHMIDIGFKQLRLNKIYLTTRGFNEQAYRAYTKLGFVVEGTLRKHCFVDGQYYDTYMMGLLAEEWLQG